MNEVKFLKLVADNKIIPSLKSFSDTVLFYYLGHLSLQLGSGTLSEIGVGGSTYALIELAEKHSRPFFVVDNDSKQLEHYTHTTYWPHAEVKKILCDSQKLSNLECPLQFSYSHIDGSKDYNITTSDILFCLQNLSNNGLICQDDYGNNKWPTITDVVKNLEHNGHIKTIVVGDSSVWFTKPEFYDHWMQLLDTDPEFQLLKACCNLASSEHLDRRPRYLFSQAILNEFYREDLTKVEIEYCDSLCKLDKGFYLKMPYHSQSKFGFFLSDETPTVYFLSKIYQDLAGPDWPQAIPKNKDDIDQLPDWVKQELKVTHEIDIYKKVKGY